MTADHDHELVSQNAEITKSEELELLISKNRDYGPYNIARAPGGPLLGLAVRLHDKIARLAHLLERGEGPQHESLEDTFLDIANYGTIGQLVLRGQWPGAREQGLAASPHTTGVGSRVRVLAFGDEPLGEITHYDDRKHLYTVLLDDLSAVVVEAEAVRAI